jgi:hypothetical protein
MVKLERQGDLSHEGVVLVLLVQPKPGFDFSEAVVGLSAVLVPAVLTRLVRNDFGPAAMLNTFVKLADINSAVSFPLVEHPHAVVCAVLDLSKVRLAGIVFDPDESVWVLSGQLERWRFHLPLPAML